MDPSKIKIKVEKEEEEEEARLSYMIISPDDMPQQLTILRRKHSTSADASNVATTTQTGGSTAPGEQDKDVDIKDIKVEGADGQN